MRDRWRGLTSSSPAAIIHALHWASRASPYLRSCPSLSFPPFFVLFGGKKKPNTHPGHFPSPTPSMSPRGIFNKTHLLSLTHLADIDEGLGFGVQPYIPVRVALKFRSLRFQTPRLCRIAAS